MKRKGGRKEGEGGRVFRAWYVRSSDVIETTRIQFTRQHNKGDLSRFPYFVEQYSSRCCSFTADSTFHHQKKHFFSLRANDDYKAQCEDY